MSAIYDNWERLVAAVLKKQQLWQLFHEHSRSPSVLSEASGLSSSFNSRATLDDLDFDFARLASLSTYQKTSNLVSVSDFSNFINFEHVRLASSELLGNGTFGTAYVATMENGVGIVFRKLKPASVPRMEFNHQMEIVGGVKHPNVVSLRAYYSSEDERLMLYDYYPRGSVHSLLHGRNGELSIKVDWESRLKIAIGTARGIAEIHKHNGGKLVHGNIKSSNVFCNPDQCGCISDPGPTTLIQTTFMPTAHYYAPEVKKSLNVSQASDVYSFAILLLEHLTRMSGGGVDLVKMVTSLRNRIRAAKVFDAYLLKHPTIKKQMVYTFQIAMKCVETSMNKRPTVFGVVKMLEDMPVRDPYPTFDLKDVLRACGEGMGKPNGSFGRCFVAHLERLSVVKILKDVVVSFEEFQQHMDLIGRIGHKNVAEVRAYCYSEDETALLVYDNYMDGSVSVALHGKPGVDKTHLNWET